MKQTMFTRQARLTRAVAAAIGALALSSAALAAGDRTVYDQSRATAKTSYESARKQCDGLKANAKDVCIAEAKAARAKADADADVSFKGTPKARQEASADVAEAQYELAKERCDDKQGNEKDVCVKDAKATLEQAKADSKAQREVTDVRKEAVEDKREAQYEVQAEKCDTMKGDAKDACVDRAKKAHHQ
ncbi:hypothetical protein [Caldimonas brevitalea]|uniref:Membrane protein n=1 Tax=Caldimonas brevitalea TaxID=413882 RepID=A0A0G3BBW3_9BURK|nr:hypothetical protein [Caldimonas brevitalea]AKJ26839.1 membrane protein [Caldimonas brevitalea]